MLCQQIQAASEQFPFLIESATFTNRLEGIGRSSLNESNFSAKVY